MFFDVKNLDRFLNSDLTQYFASLTEFEIPNKLQIQSNTISNLFLATPEHFQCSVAERAMLKRVCVCMGRKGFFLTIPTCLFCRDGEGWGVLRTRVGCSNGGGNWKTVVSAVPVARIPSGADRRRRQRRRR